MLIHLKNIYYVSAITQYLLINLLLDNTRF